MNTSQKFQRAIATFFLLIFFPTLVPASLYANNNGPVAPEATSFEPVDATDMVNLATGDMSYVMPLINVPSPEGGYPLALSYHAGVAMDQEASWVGLGWSLNPGTINRSVQGTPDDWGTSRITSLSYDKGESIDYYGFSIGGTINGLSLGMNINWGAYKSWGGSVGYGPGGVAYDSKAGLGLSYMGASVNYNFDKKEFSGGVSFTDRISGSSIGMDSSGGVSIGVSARRERGKIGPGSTGISFNSAGESSWTVGGVGIENNSRNNSVSGSDYYFKVTNRGFGVNTGVFYVKYKHTNVTYSLFKMQHEYSSGILNLYDTKKVEEFAQQGNYYMDVKSYLSNGKINDHEEEPASYHATRILLPNYDGYSIASQGIFGEFSPKIYDETLLYYKNFDKAITDSNYILPSANSYDYGIKLNNKIYFGFDNVNSSFYRNNRTTFKSLTPSINLLADGQFYHQDTNAYMAPGNEEFLFNNIVTERENNFSSNSDAEGNVLRANNGRKRDGNFIEAYTNEEIFNGQTQQGFIESPGYDRQSYYNMAPKSIGAFKVTALDGKIYHYSLPVYNFEEVRKYFTDKDDENGKFHEVVQKSPYATHWLLTAVTGPDYVDVNSNNILDENDYGYWVKFDYGKWSDGYAWRAPKSGSLKDNISSDLARGYSYAWGRKEIYYLDKVQTRSHTALFVKSLRADDKSAVIQKKSGQYVSGVMNRDYTEKFTDRLSRPIEKGRYYGANIASPGENQWSEFTSASSYKHQNYKYVDLPENFSLKLDKVLLLKNSDLNGVSKNVYTGVNRKVGYSYFDYGFGTGPIQWDSTIWRKDPFDVKVSNSNMDQNVLETQDFNSMNASTREAIFDKVQKEIQFNYDYSLGNSFPNAATGRLCLKSVDFKGRGGMSVLPPYKFSYINNTVTYGPENADDWGYVKNNPEAWSLDEITTPIGGKIKVEYESDTFVEEAAYSSNISSVRKEIYLSNSQSVSPEFDINGNLITIKNLVYNGNLNNYFKVDESVSLECEFWKKRTDSWGIYSPYKGEKFKKINFYSVESIDDVNKKIVLKPNSNTDSTIHNNAFFGPRAKTLDTNDNMTVCFPPGDPLECIRALRLSKTVNENLALFGNGGKSGGGIRVKKVSVIGQDFEKSYLYDYSNPYTGINSGITPYEPLQDKRYVVGIQELPMPNVMYKYVTVVNKSANEVLAKSIYTFKTLDLVQTDSDGTKYLGNNLWFSTDDNNKVPYNNGGYGYGRQMSYAKYSVYDNLANIGSLLSVQHFNKNNQLLSSVVNRYQQYSSSDKHNGISEESFKSFYRTNDTQIVGDGGSQTVRPRHIYHFSSFSKISLPNKLISSTVTEGGYTSTTYFDKHDFLTGQVLETRRESSDGKIFKTKVVPAFTKYGAMGSKVDNINNRNMLSQTAAEYSYIYDPADANKPWKETGVGITTWSNEWTYQDIQGNLVTPTADKEKIWRKHKTYNWNGVKDNNGIFQNYNSATDDGFDWTVGVGSQPANWKQISEVTKYDHYSMTLEAKDINHNHAATKMGDKETKITAVGNAKYNELYYSGLENISSDGIWLEPGINLNGATRDITKSHSGKYSLAVNSPGKLNIDLKDNQHKAGRYKLNVWVHKDNAGYARLLINGVAVTNSFNGPSKQAGDWILKTHYFDMTTAATTVSLIAKAGATVYYDDIMLRPIASSATGYVYNEWDELISIVGNNGLATRFEYDKAGRLVKTYVEVFDDQPNGLTGGFKLSSENKMKYKYL